MTTAVVPPTGPYIVLFSSHGGNNVPVVSQRIGGVDSVFTTMTEAAIGIGIMPASGGGGGGGSQGQISFN
jgi:hypothetical protein